MRAPLGWATEGTTGTLASPRPPHAPGKWLALAACALLAAGPLAGAQRSLPVRSHYEVTLQQGLSRWTVASAADVTSGVPIRHDLGPYRLSLIPHLEPSRHYTLDVSVGLIPHGPGAIQAPDTLRFNGQLDFPLEFSAFLAGTKVNGAIMVARVRNATVDPRR